MNPPQKEPAQSSLNPSSRIKLCVLGINYNYARFLDQNKRNWIDVREHADGFLVVDDQSTQRDEAYERAVHQFGDCWTSTQHPKSQHNAINQMRAIAHGLSTIGLDSSAYYWIIDCDDVPVEGASDLIKNELAASPGYDLVAFRRYEGSAAGEITMPHRSHSFWLTDAPTSSLVVSGALLRSKARALFHEDHFKDVWYDIRLSALARPNRTRIANAITHIKTSHESNDSLRYRQNRVKIVKRIFSSLAYRFTVAA